MIKGEELMAPSLRAAPAATAVWCKFLPIAGHESRLLLEAVKSNSPQIILSGGHCQ